MKKYRKNIDSLKEFSIKENMNFDKTIVVGHKLSEYKRVYKLLQYIGMSSIKDSIATTISSDILKAHKKSDNYSEQLKVERVWEGLALNLFRSYSEEKWWGWADYQVGTLLEYWSKLDSKISFVLVYNSPKEFLHNYFKNYTYVEEDIEFILEEWYLYNKLLLEFFYKNQSRSILVDSKGIDESPNLYFQQIEKQLDGFENSFKNFDTMVEKKDGNIDDKIMDYFIDIYIMEKYNYNELYKELQSVANIPKLLNQEYSSLSPLKGIEILLKQKKRDKSLRKEIKSNLKKLKLYTEIDKEKDLLSLELKNNKQEFIEKEIALRETFEQSIQRKEDENSELLIQFMNVQEELEKYYLELQTLKKSKKEIKRYYGAAERIKHQLSYRLGQNMIEKSKSFFGIMGLPFTLIQVYIQYKEDINKREKLPKIDTYSDAYDAQRVKKHLSYMLGQTMIKTMKNPLGLFILPFSLKKTYEKFKQQDR